MNLETNILGAASQTEKAKCHVIAYVRNLKENGTNELIYKTETDWQTERKLRVTGRAGRERGRSGVNEGKMERSTPPSRWMEACVSRSGGAANPTPASPTG